MAARLSLEPSNRPMVMFEYSPEEFDLDAPYQRGSVWTHEQKVNLVRSILWGIPIGSVIIARQLDAAGPCYRVVDGKQRIETIIGFWQSKFAVPRKWFDESQELTDGGETATYEQLTDTERVHWQRATVQTVEFDPSSEYMGKDGDGHPVWRKRSEVEIVEFEAMVYLLVNRGGVPHEETDLDVARSITDITP